MRQPGSSISAIPTPLPVAIENLAATTRTIGHLTIRLWTERKRPSRGRRSAHRTPEDPSNRSTDLGARCGQQGEKRGSDDFLPGGVIWG
jgi:hypothetical protein